MAILHIKKVADTSFKRHCLDLPHPSTYLFGVCIVLHDANWKNRSSASLQCSTDYNGHLASIYNQAQIDKLAAVLDLTMPAWCDLQRDPNDTNSWLHTPSASGPKPKSGNPPWDPNIQNNPTSVGDGVVVTENGLNNQDETVDHGFLCEYAEPVHTSTLFTKKHKGLRASSEGALNQWTVKSKHICGENCAATQECRSFGYNKSNKECHLFSLPSGALSLTNDSDFELYDKIGKESDCVSVNDCAPEATHLLFIGGKDAQNIESYYPLDPSKNGIVATLSGDLQGCVAELYDGKVLITGAYDSSLSTVLYDPRTNEVTPVADLPQPRKKPAAATLHGAVVVCGGEYKASCVKFQNYQWVNMTKMNEHRFSLRMVNYKNKLYAMGGFRNGDGRLDTIERFDDTNTWTVIGSMPIASNFFGVAVYQDTLFMCGGMDMEDHCYKYQEQSDDWILMGSYTNVARKNSQLLVFNGHLYIVSGRNSVDDSSENRLEIYDASSDSWSFAATQKMQDRNMFASVVV